MPALFFNIPSAWFHSHLHDAEVWVWNNYCAVAMLCQFRHCAKRNPSFLHHFLVTSELNLNVRVEQMCVQEVVIRAVSSLLHLFVSLTQIGVPDHLSTFMPNLDAWLFLSDTCLFSYMSSSNWYLWSESHMQCNTSSTRSTCLYQELLSLNFWLRNSHSLFSFNISHNPPFSPNPASCTSMISSPLTLWSS